MSQVNASSENGAQRASSPTPSERSTRSDISTTSSRLPKPSGIKPPSATIKKPSTSTITPATPVTPRIGRLCTQHGHGHKAGPPSLDLHKSEPDSSTQDKMRRQSDEYSRSHLPDVYEESEADLLSERNNNDFYRSTKSRSPDYSYNERKGSKGDRRYSNESNNSDLYVEATGRRRSSDQGVVLTTDTDQFIIGQRVYVGGHRPGQIAFIGETQFAAGDWAGIVLDDTSGKNDGCVSGKRYFQCEPKRGIFSRLTRLTLYPLTDMADSPTNSMTTSARSFASPPRSGTVSPTRSVSSYVGKSPAKSGLSIGDRVIVSSGMGSRAGILQYCGETKFAPGNWCGVQLDEPTGKNDGTVDGVQYFVCPPSFGIFVPLAKVSLSPLARKTRLSRAGSKESLTSFGTMGSITSTNTSRLRMSAQDLLREKQNHVEQLILERDLTRQQTENDTMMFQKAINQLKEKVTTLEKQLTAEQQKAEDLQFNIDEVTICGSDQNTKNKKPLASGVQAVEYNEKIAQLEKELSEARSKLESTASGQTEDLTKLREDLAHKSTEVLSLSDQCERLKRECDNHKQAKEEIEKNVDIKISSLGVSENCLREEIDYYKRKIEEMKAELVRKDEVIEKEFLSLKSIENDMKDEITSLQDELKAKNAELQGYQNELKTQLTEKDSEIVDKNQSLEQLKQQLENLLKDKEAAISSEKSALNQANDEYTKIQNELTESKNAIEQYLVTIQELQKTLTESSVQIDQLSNDNKTIQSNLEATKQENSEKIATNSDLEKLCTDRQKSIDDLLDKYKKSDAEAKNLREAVLVEKDQHIKKLSQDISELTGRIDEITAAKTHFEQESNGRASELSANAEKIAALEKGIDHERKKLAEYKTQVESINQSANKNEADYARDMADKLREIERLQETCHNSEIEFESARKQCEQLSSELQEAKGEIRTHTSTISTLNEKLHDLENSNITDTSTIDSLNGELKKHNAHIEELTKANADVKSKAAELQSALDGSIDENDKKERNLKDAKQRIDQLQLQLDHSHGEVEKNKTAVEEVNAKLHTAQNDFTTKAQQLAQVEIEFADLQRKQAVTEEKCEQLAQEKSSLQQNLDAVQSSSSDANGELIRLMEEIKSKQKSYDELADSSNAIKLDLEKRLHECQQNFQARTVQWEQLNSEMDSITAHKIDRENELNLELATIKEANEMEAEALKNEIDALKQSFKSDKEKLMNDQQSTIAQFESIICEHKSTIDNLENTMKNVQLELTKARKDIAQKNDELGVAANRYSQLESKLNEQIDHTRRAEENVRAAAKTSSEKLAARDKEIQGISTELQAQKTLVTDLENKLKAKQCEVDSVDEVKSNVESQLTAQIASLTDANGKLKDDCNKLTGEKTELDEKLKKLGETFRDTEDEQVDLVNKNLELQKQIDVLAESLKQIDVLKEEIDQKDANLGEATAKFVALQKEFDEKSQSSSSETVAKSEQIALLEKRLAEAEENFERFQNDAENSKTETDNAIQKHIKESDEKDVRIKALEEKVSQLAPSVNLSDDLKNELKDKAEELRLKESNITELMTKVVELQQQCAEKDANLQRIENDHKANSEQTMEDVKQKTIEIEEVSKRINAAEKTIAEQAQQITNNETTQRTIETENNGLKSKLAELTENKSQQKTDVATLQAQIVHLEDSKKTEIEQMTLKLWDGEEKIKEQSESIERLMHMQSSDEETTRALKTREAQLLLDNKKLEGEIIKLKANLKEKDRLLTKEEKLTEAAVSSSSTAQAAKSNDFVAEGEPGAQISFLNSIIADMQVKNEALKEQIRSTELFKNPLFDVPVKRKPAPRLFCDICDIFDAHDTEDCPVQSGESPTHPATINVSEATNNGNDQQPKKRVLPPARKYCENCEVFGHEAGECDVDETY